MSTSRLIQITDCHLGGSAGEKLLGLDTDESLSDVLELISAREKSADLLVATGDIASGAQVGAYQRFPARVAQYLSTPLAWLPGNHDRSDLMQQWSMGVQMEHVELQHWQVLLLDSSVPGHEHGDLRESELQRCVRLLQNSSKPALVFVHHQPLPVGSNWIDQYVIRNGDRLLQLLSGFTHVKSLIWGHVHQEYDGHHQHFRMLATPSTCIQFKPFSYDFALDDLMPGYRWFDLHADGSFATGVERIAHRNYDIDFNSQGY